MPLNHMQSNAMLVVKSGLLEEAMTKRVGLRCVLEKYGPLCVMTSGDHWMLKLFADS